MKKRIIKTIALILLAIVSVFTFSACDKSETVTRNIQKDADNFNTYRKMTFVNLYTNTILYTAEGYFSLKSTYENSYQGQQEIALVFMVAPNEYKMNYFSVANNVTYVIEQIENTHTNPYYWDIIFYVPLPTIKGA